MATGVFIKALLAKCLSFIAKNNEYLLPPNVTLTKCPKMSQSFLGQTNVLSNKCLVKQMFGQTNVWLNKCLVKQMFG
jgi:hypothetical protein